MIVFAVTLLKYIMLLLNEKVLRKSTFEIFDKHCHPPFNRYYVIVFSSELIEAPA